MTGLTEILVLIFLILGVLILPRLFKPLPEKKSKNSDTLFKLSPLKRAYIIISIGYPIGIALYQRPWEGNTLAFITIGILPVLIFWSVIWIWQGREKK